MIDPWKSMMHRNESVPHPLHLRVALGLALAATVPGCDDPAPATRNAGADAKPNAKPVEEERTAAPKPPPSPASTAKAEASAPLAGSAAAQPMELSLVERAPTPASAHLWLQWDGSQWQYNNTSSSLTDPPPSWTPFKDPKNPTSTKSYGGMTNLRVFVNNTTGKQIPVTFEQAGRLKKGSSHVVTLSDEYGSWDDWHVTVGEDPVFHINKGSTTPAPLACAAITLEYVGGDDWQYGPTGGAMSPAKSKSEIGCSYDGDGARDFDITITNSSDAEQAFTISETRSVGTLPYGKSGKEAWNNIAWQIGEDPGLGDTNTWKIRTPESPADVSLVITP